MMQDGTAEPPSRYTNFSSTRERGQGKHFSSPADYDLKWKSASKGLGGNIGCRDKTSS